MCIKNKFNKNHQVAKIEGHSILKFGDKSHGVFYTACCKFILKTNLYQFSRYMEVVKVKCTNVMISNLSFHTIFNKYKYFYYSTA